MRLGEGDVFHGAAVSTSLLGPEKTVEPAAVAPDGGDDIIALRRKHQLHVWRETSQSGSLGGGEFLRPLEPQMMGILSINWTFDVQIKTLYSC